MKSPETVHLWHGLMDVIPDRTSTDVFITIVRDLRDTITSHQMFANLQMISVPNFKAMKAAALAAEKSTVQDDDSRNAMRKFEFYKYYVCMKFCEACLYQKNFIKTALMFHKICELYIFHCGHRKCSFINVLPILV